MTEESELLDEINRDLPKGIDWKDGAREYVKLAFNTSGQQAISDYALTKPMYRLMAGDAGAPGREQAIAYLFNFVNMLKLLDLPPDSYIMDVACGAGWMSHYFSRFGFKTFGFDIAADFVELAKKRLLDDHHLGFNRADVDRMFATLDIESEKPGDDHIGKYDAIILESCLHHFYNPISALSHLEPCLKDDGVMMLIEGENRMGEIKKEYMDIMVGWRTIERPYKRQHLTAVLETVGLAHYEFLGQVNGMYSPKDPIWGDTSARLRETERCMNIAICARNRQAIDRVLPGLVEQSPIAEAGQAPAETPAAPISIVKTRKSFVSRLISR